MFDMKTVIWMVIALIFGVLAFYSHKSVKLIENQIHEMDEKSKENGVQATVIIAGTDIHDPIKWLCKSVKSVSNIGTIAAVISSIVAILSIFI
ncbi:hypothetical protein [Methanobacterium spitsbergense]|uniref:Uncharacterized protein n=1 Tax=Methanobacterium spitsbergense TaxID=2874285 RepID=A0A8T5V254_9EURY|nr:hypothetical protein [Methanobacterium spitsbergense]MBZ2167029.1 hypothetical protein [Methanobacterium spitsbergense]